mgnify:FL=1
MIKVLKEGLNLHEDDCSGELTCPKCQCEFHFDDEDISFIHISKNDAVSIVECPNRTCNKLINVTNK